MSQNQSSRARLPKGVTALPRPRGGRGYRASIRNGKGIEIHLGLYETLWLAAFAFGIAAEAFGRETPPVDIPRDQQPSADQVREITTRVRRRLRLNRAKKPRVEVAPDIGDLRTLFEVTIVGFWRNQVATHAGDNPSKALDHAANRLIKAANLLFWSKAAGHPEPIAEMSGLLVHRLHSVSVEPDLTREFFDDDGDDLWRLARWLVYPDAFPGGHPRGFRAEIVFLYPNHFEAATHETPAWAEVLGIKPPFDPEQIRAAYRACSLSAHPDAGGSDAEFVRLRHAYEEARAYLASRGT